MSICRARIRNTSNALTLRMSGEQIRQKVPPNLFWVNSRITQMIRQWIPDCWSGDKKCRGPKRAAANSRNWQLMTSGSDSGRSQMLATGNFRHWHTVFGEVPWSSVPNTTMDRKLVLNSLRNNQLVQVVVHQPRLTITLVFLGPCDQTCCGILNMLQHVHDLLRCGK